MDRIARRRLVESELMRPSAELVATFPAPGWATVARNLPPARHRAHLVARVAVEQVVARGQSVRAQPAAEPDDDGALFAERELDLVP